MTYAEALSGIHSRKAFSSSASLERMIRLMDRLGNPQDRIKCIHVAGTNGKGSVCALVESALRAAGYRVGLFTSPYLVDFRERIQVDREMISREELIACYETVMERELALEQEGYEPVNEFELVTALGFVAFARANVDYGVIEVGLGGRYDATNILKTPEVCCITSISLDHTAVLGNTVTAIAGEKAGIMKPSCPVVIAKQTLEVNAVLTDTAEALSCRIYRPEDWVNSSYDRTGQRFHVGTTELFLPLLGRYQGENAAAAWAVCCVLGLTVEDIHQGFSQVRWPGRLQYIEGRPGLLIDAGHNLAGISALCETLDELFPQTEITAVMAMMGDKDHACCVPMVARRAELLIAARVDLPRCLSSDALAAEAGPYCRTETASSISEALARARDVTKPEGLIVVCGSVYAAGEALVQREG